MAIVSNSGGSGNPPKERDLRLREQFFPNMEALLFDTASKGYGPLPIMLRKVLRHLSGPELRVLIYLYTRSSKYRICYPTVEEIAEELEVSPRTVKRDLRYGRAWLHAELKSRPPEGKPGFEDASNA